METRFRAREGLEPLDEVEAALLLVRERALRGEEGAEGRRVRARCGVGGVCVRGWCCESVRRWDWGEFEWKDEFELEFELELEVEWNVVDSRSVSEPDCCGSGGACEESGRRESREEVFEEPDAVDEVSEGTGERVSARG
jgi:hypothetical protein